MQRTWMYPPGTIRRHPGPGLLLLLLGLSLVACGPTEGGTDDEQALPPTAYATKVDNAVYSACSTAIVRGLSDQLVAEVECLRPGTIASIDGIPGVSLGSAVLPYLQASAATSLRQAAASGTITLNSAIRSLAQQYLLRRWYELGRCGIGLAAKPGASNHESGLAIDVDNYSSRKSALQGHGFSWFGSSDPVHFDYVGGGTDVRSLSVLAFQRLWNRNHPEDLIAEDGDYGPQTASRLGKAPVTGFTLGATCAAQPEPDPETGTGMIAIEVYWARNADGSYKLHALGPPAIEWVEYYADGILIDTAWRTEGENFPGQYTFIHEGPERPFEVRGYDHDGNQVGLGVGMIDVTAGTAVYIKQMGAKLYEVGLERPPSDVASIEVVVDGYLLTDDVSGQTRSTRLAVRHTYNVLGERLFEVRTYNASGTLRGTLRRTFTLR